MKIVLNALPGQKTAAVAKVNAYFAAAAASVAMQEAAWLRKREVASSILSGADTAPAEFTQEAALRGITTAELARLILSKADPAELADAREFRRQRALLAIDAATTPAELDAILAELSEE